jgi:hypothetical protein
MMTSFASRTFDYFIGAGPLALVALQILWVWPIALFRVF